MATESNATPEKPWYADYPEAKLHAEPIAREEVLRLLKSGTDSRAPFVLVDLRRTDYEVALSPGRPSRAARRG